MNKISKTRTVRRLKTLFCLMVSLAVLVITCFMPVFAEDPRAEPEADSAIQNSEQSDPISSEGDFSEDSAQSDSQSFEGSSQSDPEDSSSQSDRLEDSASDSEPDSNSEKPAEVLNDPDSGQKALDSLSKENSSQSDSQDPSDSHDLVFENDQIRASLQQEAPSENQVLFVGGPWKESDPVHDDLIFTVSLSEDERTVEPAGSVHLSILFKSMTLNPSCRLIHRLSMDSSEWLDVRLQQTDEGTLAEFDSPSLSEFVLESENAQAQSDQKQLILYDLSGNAVSTINSDVGSTVILPFDPTGNIPSSGQFMGWSTTSAYISNGEAWKYHPLYPPGATFVWSDSSDPSPVRLYPIWASAGNRTWADFFIRLDGTIPNEPTSSPASAYTSKIPVMGGLNYVAPRVSSSGFKVGPKEVLAKEPTASQLADVISARADRIGFSAAAVGNELYKTQKIGGVWRYVDANGSPVDPLPDGTLPPSAVKLSILWYVIKKEQYNWHVDGVLLQSSKYRLIYSIGSAATGEVTNMPDGHDLDPETTVYTGHSQNNPNNRPSTPLRAGYEFLGWQDVDTGQIYQPSQTFAIEKNTTLQALWKPDVGSSLTLMKTDAISGARLANAYFKLEDKNNATSPWNLDATMLRTQSNGTFLYDGLQVEKIYRLTETDPPAGYLAMDPIIFRIINDQGELKGVLCDQNGKTLPDPDGILQSFASGSSVMLDFRVTNRPILAALQVIKTDRQGNPLAKGQFQIFETDGNSQSLIDDGTSSEDGVVQFRSGDQTSLGEGDYVLREIYAPDGYHLSPDVYFQVRSGVLTPSSGSGAELKTDPDTNLNTLVIRDQPGILLPATGSSGRLVLRSLSILAAAAALILCLVCRSGWSVKGKQNNE